MLLMGLYHWLLIKPFVIVITLIPVFGQCPQPLPAAIPILAGLNHARCRRVGRRQADVDGASARLDRARADALQARQAVDQPMATARLTAQTATAQVQAAQVGVTAAQESYDLATLRYNAGKSVTAERRDALTRAG
jgi:hypothetical protein